MMNEDTEIRQDRTVNRPDSRTAVPEPDTAANTTTQTEEQPLLQPAVRRFTAGLDEKVLAFLSFIPAYLYVYAAFESMDANSLPWKICFPVFVLLYIVFIEILFRNEKHPAESWVWLMGLVITAFTSVFPLGQRLFGLDEVWEEWMKLFMAHAFAVYWTLSRGGRLSEGKSSHLLPLDIVNGLFIIPFKRFILRIWTIITVFRDAFSKNAGSKSKKKNVGTVLFALLAIVIALALFIGSMKLLSKADSNFERYIRKFLDLLDIEWGRFILYFFFSLPVGAFVFALQDGTKRETQTQVQVRGQMLMRGISVLQKVPVTVWIILSAVFTAAYAAFFFLQGQYLFGAFTGHLPENFNASRYAREGFFELCRVMAINLVLLWLMLRTSAKTEKKLHTGLKVMMALILAESMLFAVVAFSKLMLYIGRFGFTPLRLASSWLVVVLFLACAAALITLFSGRKTMRAWMIVSAVLALGLCLI